MSNIGCPIKYARFNFVIKIIIYWKITDIFILVQSALTAVNSGTRYQTNVLRDSAGTLSLFRQNFRWSSRIVAAQFRQWHVESSSWAQEFFVACWHKHEISPTPKESGRTVTNHKTSVISKSRMFHEVGIWFRGILCIHMNVTWM